MIEVDLSTFFVLVLAMCFLGAGLSTYLDRRRDRAAASAVRGTTARCRACESAYRVSRGSPVHRCPACGRENLRGRDRRLG